MPSQILLGKSTKIQVKFYTYNIDLQTSVLVDPTTVEGFIKDASLVQIDTFTPTHISTGVYRYDWTPLSLGEFYIEFKGTYDDNTIDIARELYDVVADVTALTPSNITLGADQFITFLTTLTPMYVDVQEIIDIYPDVDPVVAAEYIYAASLEVQDLFGTKPVTLTPLVLDFVKATALWSLSKLYAIGDFGTQSIQLGDLSVQYRSPGGGNVSWDLCKLVRICDGIAS